MLSNVAFAHLIYAVALLMSSDQSIDHRENDTAVCQGSPLHDRVRPAGCEHRIKDDGDRCSSCPVCNAEAFQFPVDDEPDEGRCAHALATRGQVHQRHEVGRCAEMDLDRHAALPGIERAFRAALPMFCDVPLRLKVTMPCPPFLR